MCYKAVYNISTVSEPAIQRISCCLCSYTPILLYLTYSFKFAPPLFSLSLSLCLSVTFSLSLSLSLYISLPPVFLFLSESRLAYAIFKRQFTDPVSRMFFVKGRDIIASHRFPLLTVNLTQCCLSLSKNAGLRFQTPKQFMDNMNCRNFRKM